MQAQSSAASSAESEAAIAKASEEIARLQTEILALQTEIDAWNNKAAQQNTALTPAEKTQLNEKQLQLNQLQTTYDLYQQIYSNLVVLGNASGYADGVNTANDKMQSTLALYEQIRANLLGSYEDVRLARLNSTSNIVQIEPAIARTTPIRPQTSRNTAMGAAVGLLLAAMIIFLIEYLDDTLKSGEQITEKFGLPVIGYIADMEHNLDLPYVAENPRSPISESFRTLRTNLEFAAVDTPLKSILIVSANPSEGKSTIAANLAVTIAQGGKHVLLIDADLRRPRIHKYFKLPNRIGLSDYFRNSATLADILQQWKDPNLAIITSGGIPPNPADLLASKKMVSVLEAGKNSADIVIVDSPPFLVADASILASHVDGVLLVVYPGKTPLDAIQTTLEQMDRAGAHVIGVVMNRIPRNRAYYYGGNRYSSPYYRGHYHYSQEGDQKKKGVPLRSRLRTAFSKPKSIEEEDSAK
jgi:succinoglycan biosynthesis transport protein ExoP